MSAAETRDRICEAAMRVANRDGLLAMTLDKVAKEAQVSKGGVMYHFRSKDELIRGVLEYFCGQCESMLIHQAADDSEPRMRWARCLVKCMFPVDATLPPEKNSGAEHAGSSASSQPVKPGSQLPLSSEVLARFMLATLTAAVNQPEAMAPIRELAVRLRTRMLSDPVDGVEQLLVWLAIDGLFLWQFMGVLQPEDPLMIQLADALRKRVTPEGGRP